MSNNMVLMLQELRGPRAPVLFPGMVRCNGCRRPGESTGCRCVVPAARIRVGDSKGCSWTPASPMNVTRKKTREGGSFWSPALLSGGAPNCPKGSACYVPVAGLGPRTTQGRGSGWVKTHGARCHAAVSSSWLLPHRRGRVGGRRRRHAAGSGCRGFADQLGPS